jgi:hypothetical protein
MENHVLLWSGLTAIVLALCWFTMWARIRHWYRWSFILLGVTVGIAAYPSMLNLLSRPKDVTEEWYHRHAAEALVSGVYVDEGVALYLYLVLPEMREPRSYKFAWNDETRNLAQSLQDSLEEAQGQGVAIPQPFEPSLEREKPLTAHPVPQTAPPQKQQPDPPIQYRGASYKILEPPWWWKVERWWL